MKSVPNTQEVTLTSVASVVLVDLPVGAPYTYRFRRFDGDDRGETKRIEVGSYLQGSGRPGATILSHHVEMGGDWTLDHSHRLSAAISSSAAEMDYPCQTMSGVVVCDASREEQRLPN
jgi:hypothetical protein